MEMNNPVQLYQPSGPDVDLLHFDKSLWALLQIGAQNKPEVIMAEFGLTERAVSLLANAPEKKLSSLASGTRTSFLVANPKEEFLTWLSQGERPPELETVFHHNFDTQFWLLARNLGRVKPQLAPIMLRLPRELIERISHASEQTIRTMSIEIPTKIKLVATSSVITAHLDAEESRSSWHGIHFGKFIARSDKDNHMF